MKIQPPPTEKEIKKYTELQLKILGRHQKVLDTAVTNFILEIKGKRRKQVKIIMRRHVQDWKKYVAAENNRWPDVPLKPSAFEEMVKNYVIVMPEPSLFTKIIKKIFNL